MTNRTEIEWTYEPAGFFESPVDELLSYGRLTATAGKAIYTLTKPVDPLPSELRKSIQEEIRAFFRTWEVATHSTCTLGSLRIVQRTPSGIRNQHVLIAGTGSIRISGVAVDFRVTDSSGKVIADSRADRINAQQNFVRAVGSKPSKSPVLQAMMNSYLKAMQEPDNELVHLYEILEAARANFGNGANARKALGIVDSEWRSLRELANNQPLRQGRHRGQNMPNLRDATSEELATARAIARKIMEGFARPGNPLRAFTAPLRRY